MTDHSSRIKNQKAQELVRRGSSAANAAKHAANMGPTKLDSAPPKPIKKFQSTGNPDGTPSY